MSDEDLARKLQIFQDRKGTTHWPVRISSLSPVSNLKNANTQDLQQQNVVPVDRPNNKFAVPRRPDDTPDPANRTRPFVEPEETPVVLKLVGVRA